MRFVIVFVLMLLVVPLGHSNADSSFVTINLPHKVTIDTPRHWWVLNDEHNKVIATARDAALDLSGMDVTYSGDVLFASNSMPRSTYASLRVSFDGSQPITAQDFRELETLSDADLKSMAPQMIQMQANIIRQLDLKVLEYEGLFNENYGGHPAWSLRYKRSGQGGPVVVDIVQVFRPDGIVRINLAYRESEAALWKVVIRRIKGSIAVD